MITAIAAAALIAAPGASAAPGAKLRVTKIDSFPASVAAGSSFELSGTVRNSGRKKADAELTASLRNGPEIGSDTVNNVPGKGKKSFDFDVTIPGDTPAGQYVVRVCVPRKGTSGKLRCRSKGGLTVTGATPPPQFTPGARTLGDDLFPQVGNGGYDALHYAIHLDYDPVANTFDSGTSMTMTARATQNLSQFSLDFQEQLQVDSVTVNGQPAQFQFAETESLGDPSVVTQLTKLVVTPATGIPAGSQFSVAIGYSGTPVQVVDVDESLEGWIRACYGPGQTAPCDGGFVVNQPNGAQGWFPSNNYPTDKATFDTTIVVPSGYEAFGIGELTGPPPSGGGDWVWSYSEDDRTPTYLTTATVGQFDFEIGSMVEQLTSRALPIYDAIDSSYDATQKANVNGVLDQTPAMTNFLGGNYGPYPYDSIGAVVDRTVGVGYALEVATKPHYSQLRSPSAPTFPNNIHPSTHLHEIAHQWFGNAVTLAQWSDIWFNEGWAVWSEWIWNHEINGPPSPAENFDSLYANTAAAQWEIAPAVLDGDPVNLFARFPVYDRGAMVIEATRQILGEDGFDELIDAFVEGRRYGNVTTEEFIEAAKDVSGFTGAELDQLDEFYDQWLYGEEKPTLLPGDFVTAVAGASDGGAAPRIATPHHAHH